MNLKKFFKNQFKFSWDGFGEAGVLPFALFTLWFLLHILIFPLVKDNIAQGDAEMWPSCEAVYLGTYMGYHPIAGVNWAVIRVKHGETREAILTEGLKNSSIPGEKIYFVSVRITRDVSYCVVSEEEARRQIAQRVLFIDLTK